MRWTVVALTALLCGACDGDPLGLSSTPTIPPANIVVNSGSKLRWECPFSQCRFEGEARNTGSGCAYNVRGVTKFYDANHAMLARADWTYASKVRPGESFLYSGWIDPWSGTVANFGTEFAWDDVSCS